MATKQEIDIRSKVLRDEIREKAITPNQTGGLFVDINNSKPHKGEVPNYIDGKTIRDKIESLGGEEQLNIDNLRGGIALNMEEDFIEDGSIMEKGVEVPIYRIRRPGKIKIRTTAGSTVLQTNDQVVEFTAGGTLTLIHPAIFSDRELIIKDRSGTAASDNITIEGYNIDGSPSIVLNTNYASVRLYCNGTSYHII
jgi:hypothetical protein